MTEVFQVRPAVAKFARQMEKVLRLHDAKKGGWKECTTEYLQDKLLEEVAELLTATTPEEGLTIVWREAVLSKFKVHLLDEILCSQNHTITHEAVDVANIAMMIADNINEGEEACLD
jgi:predicted house-cleaning noncanonical NTP pyrophosphatase (MazG superfamily)